MQKIIEYFQLKDIGAYELLFALYPILAGYKYSFPLFALLLFLMAIWGCAKSKSRIHFPKPLLCLAIYVFIHEMAIRMLLNKVPGYFDNNLLSYAIVLVSIPFIASALNYKKLVGSMNFIAVVCMIGLVYQYMVMMAGGDVHPIKLPFMPDMDETSRLYSILMRPSSFFWEPQSYCSFMMIPQFLAFSKKKIVWASIITLSMLLSGSTTGIITSLVMFILYIFCGEISKKMRYRLLIVAVAIGCMFTYSSLFDKGREKIENVEYESTSRLYNGPVLVAHMPTSDLVFGGVSASVPDYYFEGKAPGAILLEKFDSIYVSSIWFAIVKLGFVGLLLFLAVYILPMKRNKSIRFYLIPLILTLFSNPDFIGPIFAFELIFIYSYIRNAKNKIIYESTYINDTVRQ